MTDQVKQIIEVLLKGGSVARVGRYGYRLRDEEKNPVSKVTEAQHRKVKDICRKHNGLWIISLKKVRSLHGNSYANQFYKQLLNERKEKSISTCSIPACGLP